MDDAKKVTEFLGWLRGFVEGMKETGGITALVAKRIEEEMLKLGPQVMITRNLVPTPATQALAGQDPTKPTVSITPDMLGDGYRGPEI